MGSKQSIERILAPLKAKFSEFRKANDGNIIMMFGISLIPLIVSVGIAVDWGNSRWIESQIQAAGDLGALAAAATRAAGGGDDADTVTYGKQVFNENKPQIGGGAGATPTITWDGNVVTLIATAQVPSPFLSVVSKRTIPVRTVSKAAYGPPTKACILALNQTSEETVKIHGSAALDAEKCAVWSNSNASTSLFQDGSSSAKAAGFCAHGKYHGTFSPKARSKCKRVTDPFATLKSNMSTYDSFGCKPSDKPLKIQKQDGPQTLSPGVFCGGLEIQTEAQVTLEPGTFHIVGQLIVRSDATLTGALREDGGNTLLFYGPDGGFYTNGAGEIRLQSPDDPSNPYSGMAIVTDGVNAGYSNTMNGGATVDILGTVYTPNQQFKVAGDIPVNISSSAFTIVADEVKVAGSSKLNVTAENDVSNLPTDTLFISGDILLIE